MTSVHDLNVEIKEEKPEEEPVLPPLQFSEPETAEPRAETIWYACIFCSRKFYTDLPSLQAHIKRTHYQQAAHILSFAGTDVKERLLEFWRQKNQSIDATKVSKKLLFGKSSNQGRMS